MTRPGFIDREGLRSWADSVGAGTEFPRLIRRSILETGRSVTELAFPAAEGARVGGWDGSVRSSQATPFIPEGLSGWEVSVEKDVGAKADSDYERRTSSPDGSPMQDCTYVAVSLRQWTKRAEWAARRSAEGRWKVVRALALDEIEAWLEAAPITHAWISELRGLAPHGLRTIDGWWTNWSTQTHPVLPAALMLAGRESAVEALRAKLAASPQTITINASSRDEVLAFAAAFAYGEESTGNPTILARSAFVDEVTTWRSLALRDQPLVLVAGSDAVIAETGGRQSVHHVIVPVTRAASADIELPPIDPGAAAGVLTGPLSKDDAHTVARLARLSLLAARRRLAVKRELLRPSWARPPVARGVRRFLLANRWSGAHDSDKSVVGGLVGQPYQDLVEEIAKYSSGEDPLLATVDAAVSVVSPYDAYLLLIGGLTTDDLTEFKEVVLGVLGAPNPALELPVDQRWQASILGKARPHSSDLRDGIANSLALLGSLGTRLIPGSTMTPANWASWIVSDLLKQGNESKDISLWASLDDVLPELAEAAPDAFLDGVSQGLEGAPPLLQAIFIDNEAAGPFMHATHSGLLWALEICAWSPDHFGRAVDLLARLAEVDPGGRYANRPFGSLREILLPWHPQNAVDIKRRLDVIDALRQRHAAIAWRLMLTLLPGSNGVAFSTHAPSYRLWKPPEERVLMRDYWDFIHALVERILRDVGADAARWVELIPKLDDVPADLREQVVGKLEALAGESKLTEADRAQVWEALEGLIRRHREFSEATWALPASEIDLLSELAGRFKPDAPLAKHRWVFDDHMPPIEGFRRRDDWDGYSAEVARVRKEAMGEIAGTAGWEELMAFARQSKIPSAVGIALSDANVAKYEAEILKLMDSTPGAELAIASAYVANEIKKRPSWVDELLTEASLSPRQRARLLLSLWDLDKEWAALTKEKPEVAEEYWRDFPRFTGRIGAKQLLTVARGLRSVGRIGAALDLLAMCLPKEDDPELAGLAADSLQHFLEQGGQDAEVNPAGYDFVRLFEYMDRSLAAERIARLEWSYLPVLEHSDRKFTLHRMMADSPDFFVDLITKVFRARDEAKEAKVEEEEDETTPDEATRNIALNAYRLLDSWKSVPGLNEDGQLDADRLRAWVSRARAELSRLKRRAVGDSQIGRVLAYSPADADGPWPAIRIRDLLEELQSPELENGLKVEIYNQRGVTTRGLESGGAQERELAARYRADADRLADRWPRTAALLRSVSDSYEREARREDEDAERWRKGLEGPGSGPVRPPAENPTPQLILHFAYGSNLSTARLEKRIGPVRQRGIAKLEGHEIRFDKKSDDLSGKTNIRASEGSVVWGVLYELTPAQLEKLAKIEKGYAEQEVSVHVGDTHSRARTFVAKKSTPGLRPTRDYLNHLIVGAREHQLPAEYIRMLESVEVADDASKK